MKHLLIIYLHYINIYHIHSPINLNV